MTLNPKPCAKIPKPEPTKPQIQTETFRLLGSFAVQIDVPAERDLKPSFSTLHLQPGPQYGHRLRRQKTYDSDLNKSKF